MQVVIQVLLLLQAVSCPVVDIQASPTSLSRQSVFNLVRQNGGTPSEAGLLTAISFGPPGGIPESSGNPTVINDTPATGDYSVGLWQINFRGGINQPVSPTRTIGGITYSIAQIQQDLNAQAQAALAILRGTQGSWSALSTQWGGFRQNPAGVSAYGQQLAQTFEGGASTTPLPDTTGGGVTDVGNPTAGLQGTSGTTGTTTQGTTGVQGTANAGGVPPPPTGLNLSFAGSIQHVIFQFLLVIVGIALLLGGIYLLGSHK
jgi:hypothetical protein